MQKISQYNLVFERKSFKETALQTEYEDCNFNNCDFSDCDLTSIQFIDCKFLNCNISNAKLNNTVFSDALFKGSKMLGLQFGLCSKFGLSFRMEDCVANHSSFYQTKIKNTIFKNVQLREVDFTDCDVTNAIFDNCDFTDAKFENTMLEKADLRTAFNYSIDPENNKIKKAKFSLSQVAGLLTKYKIEIDVSR